MGEDLGEGEPEHWNRSVLLEFILKVSLVEYISFGILDEKYDAALVE